MKCFRCGEWDGERCACKDGQTIFHGDCRRVLPHHIKRIDCLITDPPYGIAFSEYESHKDSVASYAEDVLAPIFDAEIILHDGWCVVFQSARRATDWLQMFPRDWRIISYPKTFIQILNCIGPQYSTDFALAWTVGTPKTERGLGRDWCVSQTGNTASNIKGHPCPRPIAQIKHAVSVFSVENSCVLDPFLGSGTTLRACKDLGRRGIGIEIEERYCEIAAERLRQEVLF